MSSTRMNPRGGAWLLMESPETPMHLGVLATFKPPARARDFPAGLAEKMRAACEPAPPWNYRISGSGPLPRLAPDVRFDIDYHFRHTALPAPGGERELGIVVSRLHGIALDHQRPLWEFHLIEGLEGNRFAFYLKIHHALVEDINAVPLLLALLSDTARDRRTPPPWTVPLEGAGPPESGPEQLAGTARSAGRAALGLLGSALKRGSTGSVPVPTGAPYSTLNRAINGQRRFATQQFDTARIERLAAETGSTVNEILTYLCSSSLRRFFKEYNALPEESLVGLIPVSLQERSARNPRGALAGIRVAMGTHIGNPMARLQAVKRSIQGVREDRQSLPEDAATSYALMRAAPLIASQLRTVGRFVPPLFNLQISMTDGGDQPAWFDGARLESIYPLSHLMQFTALSIDCVNYAGTLNIGFTGARDTLPHLQRLAVYVGRALSDLEELAQAGEAP